MSKNEMDLVKFINRAKMFLGVIFFIVGVTASATTAWILQQKEVEHLKEKLEEYKIQTSEKLKKIDEIQQEFQRETKASLYRIEDNIKEISKHIYSDYKKKIYTMRQDEKKNRI